MSQLIQLKLQRRKLFKTINLESLHDNNLSWKAKALHIYLMSRPDGWKLCYSDLVNRSTDQRVSVKNGIQELKAHGYLAINANEKNKGHLQGANWLVTESPTELPLCVDGVTVTKPASHKTCAAQNQQGSKEGLLPNRNLRNEGTSLRTETSTARKELETDIDESINESINPTSGDPLLPRHKVKFPVEWYRQASSVYMHLKGLTLSGPEFDPLYHELKTIYLAGHHVTEVTGMMWWLHNERWPNWKLRTIRMRIAEWKADQLKSPNQIETKSGRYKKQSVSDAKDDLQAFVDGESQTHSDPHVDLNVDLDADAEAVSHAAN